ncbi:hypothetical protein [Deefgea salmonis]|uniref:MITD1 C-terminal phospholipase D-like domain-containing protein n=1 Tax=Deefgea salmonis TaxID=2875502 RepID=A0ABS8BJ13_9NEIS|nr:hypothetical protein [Deefgea salmonis]MCB5195709.1 hypothetical protein [Deefgea salmonis]
MSRSLVLSDELLEVYYDFLNCKCDPEKAKALLCYYSGSHLTNVSQLRRIGKEDAALHAQLAQAGYTNQTLTELAETTKYRMVLSTNDDTYPNFNVNNKIFRREFCFNYGVGEDRANLIRYIKELCMSANTIVAYDIYFFQSKNERLWKQLFNLFPNRKMSIINCSSQMNGITGKVKALCNSWTIKSDTKKTYDGLHDRYLRIDDSVEVVFSSGFEYLFDKNKELSCIVKVLN